MTVFANGLEISAKAQGCKVIAAFPDTCFTPPQTPATPPGVPLPYPNFGMDSDLTSGSTSVLIKDKTISQENKSHYKKCTGDEAGAAPKKGIVTSNNKGKVYAQKWASNVKVQGKGVVRFSDIATSNHRSNAGDTPTMVVVGQPTSSGQSRDKCKLTTYEDDDCPEGETPHHLIGDAQFRPPGKDEVPQLKDPTKTTKKNKPYYNGCENLTHGNGLCICLQGSVKASAIPDEGIEDIGLDPEAIPRSKMGDRRLNQKLIDTTKVNSGRTKSLFPDWSGSSPYSNTLGEHGRFHEQYDNIMQAKGLENDPKNTTTVEESAQVAADVAARQHGCDSEKMKREIVEHYERMGIPADTRLRSGIKNSSDSSTQPIAGTSMGVL